ncbi:RDD family protein [Dactylosporangium sp. NPDC049525]|uniref:RDD family protein n=1 Tax=Dactylosporangium sp. NPDC049525 TaxID=3154730 RepID=UPI00341AD64A
MTAPGWYKDPVDQAVQRYWDGEGWIGDPIPADEVPPAEPPAVAPPPPPPATPGTPQVGAVILPPGTPVPPGGFPPGQLPPGAVVLPPGTPLPPGLQPQGTLPPGGYPSGAVQVLLPPQALMAAGHAAAMPHGRQVATLGARLVARLIDIVVVLLINAAVTGWFVYQWLDEMLPLSREWLRRVQANESTSDIVQPERAGTLQVVILILIAALWFAYEVPSIANTGQTLGKRLLKIKVMRLESEEPIGFGRAIRRWNPLGLSVLLWTCGVGFLLQFLDSLSPVIDWPLHRAFHDRSAGTVVVRDVPSPSPSPSEPTGDPS